MSRSQKREEGRERELLMGTNFVSNRTAGGSRDDNNDRTRIVMEHGLDEHRRLSASVGHMGRLLESGATILDGLTGQRTALRAAHGRLAQMVGTLGLSQTVLRMIERRSGQDWLLFCFGCVAVLTLLMLLWRFAL